MTAKIVWAGSVVLIRPGALELEEGWSPRAGLEEGSWHLTQQEAPGKRPFSELQGGRTRSTNISLGVS